MEFAEVLETVGRRAAGEGGASPRSTADFSRVLDGVGRAAGIDGAASRAAYRLNGAAPEAAAAAPPAAGDALPSLDPADIAFELALDAATSVDDLRTARRLFARANHPDRVPAPLRDRANRRMTLANALVDEAAARFGR